MDRTQFERLHDEACTIVKRIKQKNDFITRGSVGSQTRLREEINSDKEFFEREVHRLHSLLAQMERGYVDPHTAKKLEQLKKEAKKQINRNEYLMKELIRNTYDTLEQKVRKRSQQIEMGSIETGQSSSGDRKELMVVHQGSALEKQLQAQKTRMLKQFERTIVQVHDIMKETEGLVAEQGESLDVISDNIQDSHSHVRSAAANIEQAERYQRGSAKKCAVAVGVILLIAGLLTVILLTTR